jgi:hypothetical protein
MLGAAFNETLSVAIINAILLASVLVLPALVVGCMRQAASRLSPDFALRRLEAMELERAELLYQKISQRLKEIEQPAGGTAGSFRERKRRRAEIRQQYGPELEDLRACAHHLRESIVWLRRRPILRLKSWIHAISCRFAFTGSLASYFTLLLPATVFIYFSEQPQWVQDLSGSLHSLLIWKPLDDERLLYVNGITGALTVIVTPVLYLMRRAKLYSDHRVQTQALEDFAGTNPDQLIHEERASEVPYADDPLRAELDHSDSCFTVLGVPPVATADQVREAYRAKIKQSHPDRVQGMAPIFRSLAEAETKKLNAAYNEALTAVRAG